MPEVKTVHMTRNCAQHEGGPTSADVHPDEVENYTSHGWYPAEPSNEGASDISKMTVAQLRGLASDEGITIPDEVKSKGDIVAFLTEALKGVE